MLAQVRCMHTIDNRNDSSDESGKNLTKQGKKQNCISCVRAMANDEKDRIILNSKTTKEKQRKTNATAAAMLL